MNLFEYTYYLVKQIPSGRISTYGAVARALGDVRASRAVGYMMNQNPDPDDMPCFKIVYSDGRLGGFGRGIDDKIRRLKEDNVEVKDGKIVDFEKKLFEEFQTDSPLRKLREEQIKLSQKVDLDDKLSQINTVAGIDVAYQKNAFKKACAAIVVMDFKTKKILNEEVVYEKIFFPYVSTYLSYREIPIFKKLFKQIDNLPSVTIVDGNGVLHPFGFGLASHLGVLLDIPTIGVAKKLLCGEIKENKIFVDDVLKGFIFKSSMKLKNPVYVSPGHKISAETSLRVVKHFCKFRVPEPVRQAHILANKKIKELEVI